MGRESQKFYVRYSEVISEKRKKNYAFIASWIRKKFSFVLANSLCICLRGRRSVYCTSKTNSGNLLSSLAKLHQILVQLYYPFEFCILHKLHVTNALNVP